TGRCGQILERMKNALVAKGVEVHTCEAVERLVVEDNVIKGVETADGRTFFGRYVVVAPGREGAEWLAQEARRLQLEMAVNPVDIGVRVELPAAVMEHLTRVIYESKLIYHSRAFDDKVRTFCMNPYGEVVTENNDGLITVNGHSHAHKKTENTNFALLVSKTFTEPFKEPIAYGKYVARLANLLGGGVIVQRLGDLLDGRRTTYERLRKGLVRPTLEDATPGDLSLVFPYRHLVAIVEMLQALDKIAPGVASRHTLLYGVEVKFYSSRLQLNKELETRIANLYAAGDGAGVTRGLAQASVAGVVAARSILAKEGVKLA
ncbi:MAG: NAD(P)/FAD-dependent oxidoreductase, partial [Bacillota bacterium]